MDRHSICLFLLYLLTFIYGMLVLRRHSSPPLRLLAWLPGVTILVEALAIFTGSRYHTNHWVYNLWLPLESCCLLLVFYTGAGHPVTRRLMGWLLVLLPAGMAAAYYARSSLFQINVYALLFYLFWLLIGGFIFLTDCLLSSKDAAIFGNPLSWTAVGIILYACVFMLTHATWIFTITVSTTWYSWLILLGNTFFYGGILVTFGRLQRRK